ncbi:MAG TPA: host attachment protein [Burkholderiales bacterium]|nr:host attachment protein [Burkholderiales bacterium]
METTWVLAADAARARIFAVLDRNQAISEIENFVHVQSREYDRDLRSDAQGRAHGGLVGHSIPPRTDPTEHEADQFSRSLSDFLEQARNEHRYDKLCLIAPPKFLGLLRQHLSTDAQRLIDKEIAKDISWFDQQQIADYIRQVN